MSAWMVSNAHVTAMISCAVALFRESDSFSEFRLANGKTAARHALATADLTELGKLLLQENAKSLDARYPGDKGSSDGDMYHQEEIDSYVYARDSHAAGQDVGFLAKLISCYAYQSCEHDGWETSAAKQWCDWAQEVGISVLPSYKRAPWGYDGPPAPR
ncbi:hypothetical protein KEU06_09395 [Pseudaminobacter sp. 19-2017]|uniref:Uncharacterized protein n=1 Tax=Pseudaminobacter soli (ex Zhang et al. 2022) TaxID=2831468 RepID=A0A942DWB6_9HYPH|nr:hypothetical protein [Pseudaminobacter soli]MBS3648819.1 hypothetical protein [Pseudaminobacter soli]